MPRTDWPSIGERSRPLVAALIADAAALGLAVERAPSRAVLVDAGISAAGGIEAGRRIAEICMGGLGRVSISAGGSAFAHWPTLVSVSATHPVLACLGSQYAGWGLSGGEGSKFHALASGPGRALARREELFQQLDYADKSSDACFVLEVGAFPPPLVLDKMAEACDIAHDRLTVVCTPTQSLAGTVQIVARVLEVALHKAHALGFDLEDVADGLGAAPLPPPSPSFRTAMGRTNDAILYGGRVHLFVRGEEEAAADLARRLPSAASRDHGRPFREVFEACDGDFYKIDPLLFSPAEVTVTALKTGRSFSAGAVDEAMLDRSFGHERV
jgi:methenyltetrahydromethanopterin cyclohydrolase